MVKNCVSCQGQFETEDPNKTLCPSCEAAQNIGSPQVKVGEASVATGSPAEPQTVTPPVTDVPKAPVAPGVNPVVETPPEPPVQDSNPTGEVPPQAPQDPNPQG